MQTILKTNKKEKITKLYVRVSMVLKELSIIQSL